ncbi:MAG: pyruvate kinase [Spirochaetaceae bacterium]|nr:pyruvate kinase [Spirochaetaceae bacterium]|tara:strand:+ start:24029 stop:25444 length:1416 start_codon:yes stop_codon:yes gene_type:complete
MTDIKFTRIIATLGPASAQEEQIRALIRAGADCFRLNFSHGSGQSMQSLLEKVRKASSAEGKYIPVLADIQGPKLRVGSLPSEGVELEKDSLFVITNRVVEGSATEVHSPYERLAQDLKPGHRVLLADGSIELKVESIEDMDVRCRVLHGGLLTSNKGMNLPDTEVSAHTLTDKDRADLEFISKSDIDLVAISFVRRAQDIRDARQALGESRIPVLAKLERPEALNQLNEILEEADGVMVARGDLGVEIEFERVPFVQKQILERASVRGKWAIVATEMLRSMVDHSRPTRAEVTDVANAVLDGADCVMLSEETAVGKHPALVIQAMMRILKTADAAESKHRQMFEADIISFAAGAAGAAVSAAERLGAKAIVVLAGSNVTALLLSKWRSRVPILALSGGEATLRRLNVLRGVVPLPIESQAGMEQQIKLADARLIEEGWAGPGDTIVVAGAIPLGEGKETNSIRFHRVRQR